MKLVEISVVDRPANQEANIEGFKFISLNNESMSKKLLEKFMKGESPEELKKSETVVAEPAVQVDPVTPTEQVEQVDTAPVEPTEQVETEKTEKEVELQKTLDAVLEKFNTMEEKLNKVLEFNDMLVK
jgi:Asp-tRNA(Asn)/Glu-tRNA(Gln) amidotransferase C subunit